MTLVRYILIAICIFPIAGCVAGSGKEVRFVCDNSVDLDEFLKSVTIIAQPYGFFPAPEHINSPENGLLLYAQLQQSPKMYVVINQQSNQINIDLAVVVYRIPGTTDAMPPEISTIFDEVLSQVSTQYKTHCYLK